jgi:hypothetical protein
VLLDRRALFGLSAVGFVAGAAWLYEELLPDVNDDPPLGPPKIVSIVEFGFGGDES